MYIYIVPITLCCELFSVLFCYPALTTRSKGNGEFLAIMAAPPCSTFSIARFIHSPDSLDGAPQLLRNRSHIHGLDKLSPGDRRGLETANKITLRTISLLSAAHAVGTEFILENPADRDNRAEPSLFITEEHGPIWELPELQTLATQCGAATCTFAQCRFSADHQKYATLMYTAGLAPILNDSLGHTALQPHISRCRCRRQAGHRRMELPYLRRVPS